VIEVSHSFLQRIISGRLKLRAHKQFLSRFDVVSSMVAEDALSSLFTTRQEVYHSIEFDGELTDRQTGHSARAADSIEEYWANLTPERAFLARVFVDHCISIKVGCCPSIPRS
jgi:condensin complex subunit 3